MAIFFVREPEFDPALVTLKDKAMLDDGVVLFRELPKTLRKGGGLQLALDGSCLLQFNETGQATWALMDQGALVLRSKSAAMGGRMNLAQFLGAMR
jgi:hypothetical protein